MTRVSYQHVDHETFPKRETNSDLLALNFAEEFLSHTEDIFVEKILRA